MHRAALPSWPPEARIPGLVWARRAPLMLMMRAPALHIMRSRPRAEAASSNLLALHRAVQKLAPTPHGTRARFAAIHQLISSFRVRAGDPAGAHHEHQRDPRGAAKEGRRLVPASLLKGFAFSFAKLWRPKAAATEGARCAARFQSLRLKPPTPQELEERTLSMVE